MFITTYTLYLFVYNSDILRALYQKLNSYSIVSQKSDVITWMTF